jgi:RNA-directed DNA polymerase
VLLDEVDRELEWRGHRFARYADDCNAHVRSQKAGGRVMALFKRRYDTLHLKIKESKSAVASALGRRFQKALETFKQRIRQLTARSGRRSIGEVIERLRSYVLGSNAYFQLAQSPRRWQKLDEWTRRRMRVLRLKHWRRGKTMYPELLDLGAKPQIARPVAALSRRWWHNSMTALHHVLTIAHFDRLGIPRLS